MTYSKCWIYVFIALLLCCGLVHGLDVVNNDTEIENEEFYKDYEINSFYVHGNTVYYDIEINKMPITLY